MNSEHDGPPATHGEATRGNEPPGDYWSRTRRRASERDASTAGGHDWTNSPLQASHHSVSPHHPSGQIAPHPEGNTPPPPPPGHRHALSMAILYLVGAMLLIWTTACVAVTLDYAQDGDGDLVIGLGMTVASAVASAVVGGVIIRGHRKRAWYRNRLEELYYRRHG